MKFHNFKTLFPSWVAQKNIGFKCREMGVGKQSIFFCPFLPFSESKKNLEEEGRASETKMRGLLSPQMSICQWQIALFFSQPFFPSLFVLVDFHFLH